MFSSDITVNVLLLGLLTCSDSDEKSLVLLCFFPTFIVSFSTGFVKYVLPLALNTLIMFGFVIFFICLLIMFY